MPKSESFRINNKGTLKSIMNPKPPAPNALSDQGKMEQDIMKHLLKQSKKEALAEVLPTKKSLRSKKKQDDIPPPIPKKSGRTPPIPNQGIVKEDLINTIIKYQTNARFGTIINKELGIKYSRAQLTKYTIDNLETILHRIRTHLNTRNMDKVFEHMIRVSAKGYEDIVSGFGYNIEGFSDLLLANPAFHDAFERWKIERKIPDVPPSFQLMYIIASTTYIAHLQAPQSVLEKKVEPPKKKQIVKENQPSDQRIKSNNKPGDIII